MYAHLHTHTSLSCICIQTAPVYVGHECRGHFQIKVIFRFASDAQKAVPLAGPMEAEAAPMQRSEIGGAPVEICGESELHMGIWR